MHRNLIQGKEQFNTWQEYHFSQWRVTIYNEANTTLEKHE